MASIPGKFLNQENIMRKVFDETTDSLRVNASVSGVNVNLSASSGDNVAISDGVDTMLVNPDGSINVNPGNLIISHVDDSIRIGDGTNLMAVNSNGDINAGVTYKNFESNHLTLSASTDTTITFTQAVKFVRVTNWDVLNTILVKNGALTSNTDSTASRVGVAPAVNLSNNECFPITTTSIHIRSAAASVVTVEGFS